MTNDVIHTAAAAAAALYKMYLLIGGNIGD